MSLCNLNKISRDFENNSLTDISGKLKEELLKLKTSVRPGSRIAIAVGSRGISNLALIAKEVAGFIRDCRSFPFIIPAMGSHGGATAAGQADVLSGYGISEPAIGVPVISSMDVVELARGDCPVPVFIDKNAWESDGVILINRIKPHTDYHGRYESGLVKMSVIGLGKEKQASAVHSYGVYGLSELIPLIAKQVFAGNKIIGGIGLVENKHDHTMHIEALRADEFFDKETVLLKMARENMPSLPVKDIDILIIDRMGKDISGVGIDTNIIGRIKINGQKEPENPKIKAIVVLDLTENSHGNAIGSGLADVITDRLFKKIDFPATYTNAVTSSFLERAKIPVIAANDREGYEIALRSCGYLVKGEERILRIRDTLHLDELYVSDSILDEIKNLPGIRVIKKNINMFTEENDICSF